MTRSKSTDDSAAITAYIQRRGVTRCPTACAIPTHATIPAADRVALAEYGLRRERAHQHRMAVAAQGYGNFKVAVRQDSESDES